MRIGFLYYNCLGFDIAPEYTDIILNTIAAVVYKRIAFTWLPWLGGTVEKC